MFLNADLSILKSKLTSDAYDNVRLALGLEPLKDAVEKGTKITSNIREKIENNS